MFYNIVYSSSKQTQWGQRRAELWAGAAQTPPTPTCVLVTSPGTWPFAVPRGCRSSPSTRMDTKDWQKKILILSLSQCHPGSSEQLVPKTFLTVICLSSPLKGFFGAIANVHLGCSNNHSSGTEPSRVQSSQESLEASEALCEICGFALWVEN